MTELQFVIIKKIGRQDSKPCYFCVPIFARMLCNGSKKWRWSIQWNFSSRSIAGKDFPNFEMLDAKIASALNKIIQNM